MNVEFTFSFYEKILTLFSEFFECRLFSDVPNLLDVNKIEKPFLLLRHDIDINLLKASRMADLEHKYGLKATYFVMINHPFYNIRKNLSFINYLLALGNEIGLHWYREKLDLENLVTHIEEDCRLLEDLIQRPVKSISFHKPPPELIGTSLFISGRISAYASVLMEWYISDSRGRFRVGDPIPAILQRKGNLLQFLIHPIWWDEAPATPQERIQNWFNEWTRQIDTKEKRKIASIIKNLISLEVCIE
jgi:hypothetical protein